ncbi:MAG: ROK family protein [Candidatus Zixiibacteriota bacterium]|jgi:polyphosphate glucokinase
MNKEQITEALGIDIGGSFIKSAPVQISDGKLLDEQAKLETPENATPDKIKEQVKELIERFSWEKAIGVGYPGVVKNGTALSAANVSKEWLGVNIRDTFQSVAKGKVYVINDADAAGMAEMRFGAGKEHRGPDGGTVLMLTFGTGIGSAIFINGHLVPNTELGHMYLEGSETESIAAASVKTRLNLTWEDWTERVNQVLAEYEKLFSPDLIIFGGGVTDSWDKFSQMLETKAELVRAKMENEAGLVGAALAAAEFL